MRDGSLTPEVRVAFWTAAPPAICSRAGPWLRQRTADGRGGRPRAIHCPSHGDTIQRRVCNGAALDRPCRRLMRRTSHGGDERGAQWREVAAAPRMPLKAGADRADAHAGVERSAAPPSPFSCRGQGQAPVTASLVSGMWSSQSRCVSESHHDPWSGDRAVQ